MVVEPFDKNKLLHPIETRKLLLITRLFGMVHYSAVINGSHHPCFPPSREGGLGWGLKPGFLIINKTKLDSNCPVARIISRHNIFWHFSSSFLIYFGGV
jgi:hypothetical protein